MHEPLNHPFPPPQELVDLIIDLISEDCHQPSREHRTLAVATLCACSLVAKGWTVRAQRGIFQWVELHDTTGLHSFASALRTSPHLAVDVQRLTLLRRIRDPSNALPYYSPACAEVLFPTVLAGLLPNLRYLAFDDLPSQPSMRSASWLERGPTGFDLMYRSIIAFLSFSLPQVFRNSGSCALPLLFSKPSTTSPGRSTLFKNCASSTAAVSNGLPPVSFSRLS